MNKKAKKKVIVIFLIIVVINSFLITQYTAACLDYQTALDGWIYKDEEWTIYFPWQFWLWLINFQEEAPRLFNTNVNIFLLAMVLMGGVLFMAISKLYSKPLDSHGSARWANNDEIEEMGLLKGAGVFLGKTADGAYLRDSGKRHYLVIAPTGSGKGVGLVLPNCYTWQGSLIVTDIKGENWEKTATYRKEHLKNKVLKFEPTEMNGSAKYNPFDEIRIHTEKEMADIQNLSDLYLNPQGDEKSKTDHWVVSARALFECIVIHLKYTHDKVSIKEIMEFKSNPIKPLRESLAEIVLSARLEKENRCLEEEEWQSLLLELGLNPESILQEEFKPVVHDWQGKPLKQGQKHFSEMLIPHNSRLHKSVVQIAQDMVAKTDKEYSSITSTLDTKLSIYNDMILQYNMSSSDFSIMDLINHKVPISLFLVFPPSDISRVNNIFKMIIELFCRRLMEKWKNSNNADTTKKVEIISHRLLFMIDEFPALGKLETLETALAYMRGYNLQAFLITQDLDQMNKLYTDKNGIIANCHIRIAYTPNNQVTAKWISDLLGKKTIQVKSQTYNTNSFFSSSYSKQSIARDLLAKEEVLKLSDEDEIIFIAGQSPILCKRIQYFADGNFNIRELAPPVKSDVIEEIEEEALNPLEG